MFHFPLLIFLNIYFLFPACTKTKEDRVRQLEITAHIQYFIRDETIHTNHKTFHIYYSEDLTLYKFGYRFDSGQNGKSVMEEYRRFYFVFGKNQPYGMLFDPNRAARNGSFRVDSMLAKNALGNFSWDTLANVGPVITRHSAKGELEEVYFRPGKEENKDSIKFYYTDRLRHYEYSFSKKLDSLNAMKLYKIVLYNTPYYHEKLEKQLPGRESYFMMAEGKEKDLETIKSYFETYKKMIRNAGKPGKTNKKSR